MYGVSAEGVGKCVEVWRDVEVWEEVCGSVEGGVRGVLGECGGVKKCWWRCGEVLGEVCESVLGCGGDVGEVRGDVGV